MIYKNLNYKLIQKYSHLKFKFKLKITFKFLIQYLCQLEKNNKMVETLKTLILEIWIHGNLYHKNKKRVIKISINHHIIKKKL